MFASSPGLGVDESYMVAVGRRLHLSYYDHPPIAWWLAWGSARLFGSETPLVVRLPFLLLFCVSTLLMYVLTRNLFGCRAAIWAATIFNMIPVFGVTSGSWVLPDGPLLASLLAAAIAVARAVPTDRRRFGWWWRLCGNSGT